MATKEDAMHTDFRPPSHFEYDGKEDSMTIYSDHGQVGMNSSRTVSPQEAAREVLLSYLVDNAGNIAFPVDLYKLVEHLGLQVSEAELESNVAGLIIQTSKDRPVEVFLNSGDRATRQRFTLAHEVGHYIKRKSLGGDELIGFIDYRNELSGHGTDKEEIWANQFAAELLMPSFAVRSLWADRYTVRRMAKYFDVSKTAMEVRLSSLGLTQFV